jgi:hypothetical protein
VSETGGATVAAPSIAAALARYYAALVQGGLPDATANQIVLDAAILEEIRVDGTAQLGLFNAGRQGAGVRVAAAERRPDPAGRRAGVPQGRDDPVLRDGGGPRGGAARQAGQQDGDRGLGRAEARRADHGPSRRFTLRRPQLILSLCDRTGNWSRPYEEDGYDVIRVDLEDGQDVRLLELPNRPVHGILAAPPCTVFAGSGARDGRGRTTRCARA